MGEGVMDGATIALLMILNAVIVALVSGLTTLVVSYFRTRGQNLATKHDFDELQEQLEANTKLVETIKSEVSQRDWARREWTNLRRAKLEALMEKMHECDVYLERQRKSALAGDPSPPERDCISELDALAALYFRELKTEADDFVLICRRQMVATSELGSAMFKSSGDATVVQAAYDSFMSQSCYQEIFAARSVLTAAARSLLEHIMEVDERVTSDER